MIVLDKRVRINQHLFTYIYICTANVPDDCFALGKNPILEYLFFFLGKNETTIFYLKINSSAFSRHGESDLEWTENAFRLSRSVSQR